MERHNNFDALRLIAAISVVFSHAFLIGEGRQDGEPLMWLTGGQTILGVVGVFVFFTISGYLVTQSYELTRSAPRFAAKRALRIYPGLLFCLLLSGFALGPWATSLASRAYFSAGGTYAYVVSNFTMINPTRSLPGVWFTKWDAGGVVDGPLWTLPCELAMYIMVLLLGSFRAIDLRVIAVLIVIGMGAIWFDTASSQYFSGSALWLLAFFASGMALYRLRHSGFINGRLALLACAGLALSAAFKAFILLFPIFGSYLVIYLAFARWLKPLPAARFGDLSYGLYIYGWPIEQTIVWLNGGAMSWWALFAIALPVTALFAFLSWHLVEKRALRLKPRAAAPARAKLAPVAVDP